MIHIYRGEINHEQKKIIREVIKELSLGSLEEEALCLKYGNVAKVEMLDWFQAANLIDNLLGQNKKAA